MTGSVDAIPLANLSLSLLPSLLVLAILHRWSAGAGAALY
ncbi:MAG: ABC transporter permease, partial [Acidobacteria bacterium]|nr:ABC transporter permease [Acidobacteriota bacterium]